ncbi:MAG TPA: hypothetical protein VF941_19825 [Clostridia bacterium]
MGVEIIFKDLWTYKVGRKVKKSSGKESLVMLDDKEYTHIHGELQIIINGNCVPSLGFNKNREVCLGYWIESFAAVINAFKSKENEYVVYSWEQGIPSFKFEKKGKSGYLSIVDESGSQAKGMEEWQRKEFNIEDFYSAFYRFKEELLNKIDSQAPHVLEQWKKRFETDTYPF